MKQTCFNRAAAFVFALVAVLHAVRILAGWEAVIAGRVLPMWVSGVFVLVAGFLAVAGARLACGKESCPLE